MTKEKFRTKYGPWAVIAGGSQGIGEAFARKLAERKINLILLARNKEKLDKLAKDIIKTYAVEVRSISVDLTDSQAYQNIYTITDDLNIGFLVYNAAKIPIGNFLSFSLEEQFEVLDLNCRGPIILIDHYARKMKERKAGGIILVSSMSYFPHFSHIEGRWKQFRGLFPT
ncbi:MAG: SDR family NAD(P)-dependent oxidoreductase [Candidatus Heimdallarchaeota archaeon]|nr:SDR family NAD(P)-dependent oxidoreductase [Candidatus Heimdallarchaeota archaeon]